MSMNIITADKAASTLSMIPVLPSITTLYREPYEYIKWRNAFIKAVRLAKLLEYVIDDPATYNTYMRRAADANYPKPLDRHTEEVQEFTAGQLAQNEVNKAKYDILDDILAGLLASKIYSFY
jgi:hypothetical protein